MHRFSQTPPRLPAPINVQKEAPMNKDVIISEAYQLFEYSMLYTHQTDKFTQIRFVDRKLGMKILETISDAGILYLSTVDDLMRLWVKFTEYDNQHNTVLCSWLLQTSATWMARAFDSIDDYYRWCEHMTACYAAQRTMDRKLMDAVCVHTELLDRLHTREETLMMTKANPWYTYLMTLQLSLHHITAEIIRVNGMSALIYDEDGER